MHLAPAFKRSSQAEHAERVVAVDINERAAHCTRFNAQLTGAKRSAEEVVVGDLFDPVQRQRFDLITANPPFVPSPLNTPGFRDGGRSGEDIQKRIVAGLPDHLAPGGSAHMITELGERENEPLANTACVNGSLAVQWISTSSACASFPPRNTPIGHMPKVTTTMCSWIPFNRGPAIFALQGYQRVVVVLISFQWNQWSDPASGPPWVRVDETQAPQRAAGAEIEAAFQAERLSRRPDLHDTLKRSSLRRTGPIALLDAQLLGGELGLKIKTNAKATLLGQALPVEHQLDPVERELLNFLNLDTPVPVSDLLDQARQLNVSEDSILAAITSLLRRRPNL